MQTNKQHWHDQTEIPLAGTNHKISKLHKIKTQLCILLMKTM